MKSFTFCIVALFLGITVSAQTPQSLRYQAVARDNSGNILENQSVSFRISILSGSVSGTAAYSETHTGLTTNAFGLVELEIGKGTPVAGTFSSINWGSNSFFVKIEMDPAGGIAYQTLSTSQLLSVPYALHAKTVETGDNWGSQAVIPDATLAGNGTTATPLRIADGGVTSAKITDGTIVTADLADMAITSSKIQDGTITTSDLAGDIITTWKILDGTIAANDLANSTVTTDKLGDLAVSTAKIQTGAVTSDKLGGNSVIDTKIASGAVTSAKLASMGAASGQVLTWSGTAWTPQALPVVTHPWLQSGSDIYFNSGKVGIGKIPGSDSRQFQVLTDTYQAIAGVNNSTLGTIYAQNNGTGPAADFRNKLLIVDGTQGTGKVLTSDAAGYTSWQTPAVVTDASFTGTGTTASPLKLSSFGASYGQVLKWTGTEWNNSTDDRGPFSETASYIFNAEDKNLGMGTNVPTQKLSLADGGTTCYMNIQNSSTGYTSYDGMLLGTSGLNSYVSTYEAGSLYLGTNATVRLTILLDGKVGIGTLTPGFKLDVNGSANLNKGIASGPAVLVNGDEAIWSDGTYFSWGYGGTWNYFKDAVGIDCQPGAGHMLAVNGVASKPGGGTWTAFSDIRLKDIHGQYTRGLLDILQLQPVVFSYKTGNELNLPSKSEYVGFVAQDVQKVFPETVTENKNGYLEFDMQGVNVAVINAIKELKAENDRLKFENEQVKARLEKIEALTGGSAVK